MTRTALLLAAFLASAAFAQDKPAAKPEAKPEAAPAAQEPAKPAEPQAQAAKNPAKVAHPSRRLEDARHCLAKGSNEEIIKCAEEYL